MTAATVPVPRAAALLTAFGVVPFAALAGLAWTQPPFAAVFVVDAAIAYGAVILSFIGGIHWGFAAAPSRGEGAAARYVVSIVPSLLGWAAVLLAPVIGLALLIATFIGVLAADLWGVRSGAAPAWWMPLRLPATAAVVLCLGVILSAVLIRL